MNNQNAIENNDTKDEQVERDSITLYVLTVLIWGSTWYFITLQLGEVNPLLSVGYRFALATVLMFAMCWALSKPMRYNRKQHIGMFLQGSFLFSLNYIMFYYATEYWISGLNSLIFSFIVVLNSVNARIFLGDRIRSEVLQGGFIGMVGIVLVFVPRLSDFEQSTSPLLGFLLALAATYSASLGNIAAIRNQRLGVRVLPSNAYGMAYGTILTLVLVLLFDIEWSFDTSFNYVSSLIYLAVFGSVLAFWAYLTLAGRIGADKAAYAGVMFPIVALFFSTLFENYQWDIWAISGVSLVLIGNIWVLYRKSLKIMSKRG